MLKKDPRTISSISIAQSGARFRDFSVFLLRRETRETRRETRKKLRRLVRVQAGVEAAKAIKVFLSCRREPCGADEDFPKAYARGVSRTKSP